ncbi:H-type small acid-soluble spore protein [Metabacillus sp. GX 13764]|uniref:H-type small acid-soluble spore protein n=1 Tax=Metabacillus kandeliae TaxID=2900151 RepID=UPI001E4A7051|nr:H-type small acid-soluble spore protein [Metabacillus kandeliae]MCD7035483.1 H-type small acid-soluble spore protein [Metabacillus kandeliae]
MNIQRAREISEQTEMANVTYNGKAVYIQHVDEGSGMARIYPLGQPENEKNVAVHELLEG